MTRLFGGRTVELLAPAGTFGIFRDIVRTRCDAVYCGGRALNMRMIRAGYNLSNEEISEVANLAREYGKKIYIAVNSLVADGELAEAEDYLAFLAGVSPDALIVQDVGLFSLAARLCPDIPLHASVMMNAHSLAGVEFLARHGVRRVVLSREMPLSAVREIAARTSVELEYFTHGDMCVANGSLCLYSAYLFGQSSNRGRCLKPCRWPFSVSVDGVGASGAGVSEGAGVSGAGGAEAARFPPYPLAVKDMNLYGRIPDLLAAGITSLKLEGRMRHSEFIVPLVNEYADALDRFLEDPLSGAGVNSEKIEGFRKRDWSTGYAFGVPGQANINSRGEGTGAFYSTGKMFSVPTVEREIDREEGAAGTHSRAPDRQTAASGTSTASFHAHTAPQDRAPERRDLSLTVRVNSAAQARLALEYRPTRIYLSAEPLLALMGTVGDSGLSQDSAGQEAAMRSGTRADAWATDTVPEFTGRPAGDYAAMPDSRGEGQPEPVTDQFPGSATPVCAPLPSLAELAALRAQCAAAGCELFIALPRMISDAQTAVFREWLFRNPEIDGVLVTHGGALSWITDAEGRELALAGDFSLNAYNAKAVRFWAGEGLTTVALSPELPFEGLLALPGNFETGVALAGKPRAGTEAPDTGPEEGRSPRLEVLLHGFLPVMYLDHDVSGCRAARTFLDTPQGRLTSIRDAWNRYHLFPSKETSLIPRLGELVGAGYRVFRVELAAYPAEKARAVLAACRAALDEPGRGAEELGRLTPTGGGFTYGAHGF